MTEHDDSGADMTPADFRLMLAGELGTLHRFAGHLDEAGLRLALGELRLPSTLSLAAEATGIELARVELLEVVAERLGEITGAGADHFRERAEVVPDSPAELLDGAETATEPPEPPYPARAGRPAVFDPETGTWRLE